MRVSADDCALTRFGKAGGRAAMPGKMKTVSAHVRVLAEQKRNWRMLIAQVLTVLKLQLGAALWPGRKETRKEEE